MIWARFSYYGVGPIHWIKTIMDQHVYIDILQNVMLPYAEHEMPFIWVFQQDNDPKHTSKKTKKWFADNINEALWMVVKESWERIPITGCPDLPERYI